MNSTALEMIYGRPENYRAKVAVKSGELVQLGTRAAVACCDIANIDHQTYFRSIWTERAFVEDQILNRLFVRWFREWQLSNRELPLADSMSPWQGHWIWPHTDDLDMLNAAHVQAIDLQNRTTTLATEYAHQGKN